MTHVAYSVHEREHRYGKEPIGVVVLDHDRFPCDADSLAQENHRVLRVVEYVHEHHHIEAAIVEWDLISVKSINWDMGI